MKIFTPSTAPVCWQRVLMRPGDGAWPACWHHRRGGIGGRAMVFTATRLISSLKSASLLKTTGLASSTLRLLLQSSARKATGLFPFGPPSCRRPGSFIAAHQPHDAVINGLWRFPVSARASPQVLGSFSCGLVNHLRHKNLSHVAVVI